MTDAHFVELTESWGMPMPLVQKEMVYRRYDFLATLTPGGQVLEVGSGNSLGNDLLSERCARVVSTDLEFDNVFRARAHTTGLFAVADAQKLPFRSGLFDVVAACEMIYYVPDQHRLVAEMKRLVRPGGAVFMTMPNRERPGFHPSPFSTTYHSARSIAELLRRNELEPEVYGVFPLSNSPRQRALRLASTTATRLHVVPKTLAGRGVLKKIFFGELTPFEGLEDPALKSSPQPTRISPTAECRSFQVLYAVGRPQ